METKEIRAKCKGKMAEYEIPKEILEWEGPWPMTVVGKMDFKALEKALEEISKNRGLLYDQDIVDACLTLFRKRSFDFK